MGSRVQTFDNAYHDYLLKLGPIDLAQRSKALKLQLRSGQIVVPFFGRPHCVGKQGVNDADGRAPTPAVATVLLSYVLRDERIRPPVEEKISLRKNQL